MATRREILKTMIFAGLAARFARASEGRLPLAFSTLGCPGWTWAQILDFAEKHGYAAVELRGMLGSMDLPGRPEFAAEKIAESKKEMAGHGLQIACVSSSTSLHVADAQERAAQIADAKRFIDLAEKLEAPYVRVFGNEIRGPREAVVARVAAGLHELGEYAGARNVAVIIESHGDFTDSATLGEVLSRADSKHAALLWDAYHTFDSSQEQPEFTVERLGKWIRHTHLKDSSPDGKGRKYVLTGRGDIPVKRQMAALVKAGYRGYYCFEWEKVWHPDIAEPEIAIADYAKVAAGYLQEVKGS
ncbi:MAG TPA: sugar phosphate isomerase/epimerase family protein [Candidatus Dormibacteraeota bacterium]|nr:sugar phosphate isomerase/epimerase family protein [Candidatus Dormibacteraeota bacterium]